MKALYLIPARGGSKGIPGKNIRPLQGRPLIAWTIEAARGAADGEDVIVSTDSVEIAEIARSFGAEVPFLRPPQYATDTASSDVVIRHALEQLRAAGRTYDSLVLLQPTSPLRTARHIREALTLLTSDVDMVVSVRRSCDNPYFNLVEEDPQGFLKKCILPGYTRRQDCPEVYAYNGAIYAIDNGALSTAPLHQLKKVRKYLMDTPSSIDIDTIEDWHMAEQWLAPPST